MEILWIILGFGMGLWFSYAMKEMDEHWTEIIYGKKEIDTDR